MREALRHFIGGQWVAPGSGEERTLYSSFDGRAIGRVAIGDAGDVDRAVAAARSALPAWSARSVGERLALLERIVEAYQASMWAIGEAICTEISAPIGLCQTVQAGAGLGQLSATIEALREYRFEERLGGAAVVSEPIGVCGLITPWNWPVNQIAAKVAPALAAGCTMVLKPSEMTPFSADIWAEVLARAGTPPGVFNLVHGEGAGVGHRLAEHPDITLISITGSTRAGIEVARTAAPTVKRVAQELGGKSAAILLDDAPFEAAIRSLMAVLLANAGQTCVAPTRLLVPADRLAEAEAIAARVAEETVMGDPFAPETTMGPVASRQQYERVRDYIRQGIAEGARVVTGGLDAVDGHAEGCFVRPTVFSDVTPDMVVAREEIFGPVLVIIPYREEGEAIALANDTQFGLAAYVWSASWTRATEVGRRMQAGIVYLNDAPQTLHEPFGGYRQSGNGRECGAAGIAEFLETKSIVGAAAA